MITKENLNNVLYTYSLGEFLVVFCSFFENFDFWTLGTWSWTLNGLKTSGALYLRGRKFGRKKIWWNWQEFNLADAKKL